MLRLYWPNETKPSIIDGTWTIPPVSRGVTRGTLWCRAADVFPTPLRARPGEGARAAASGMENERAVCVVAQRRCERRARRRRTQPSVKIVMATHAGMTTDEFEQIMKDWLATTKHPTTGRALHGDGLSAHARTARRSAREWFQDVYRFRRRHRVHAPVDGKGYGIPPEQVIGSSGKLKFELRDGKPVLVKLPAIDFIDDKDGKPVGIKDTSAVALSPRSATRMAICKCSNGQPRAAARASPSSFTTMTRA